jgi:hypothetical protein
MQRILIWRAVFCNLLVAICWLAFLHLPKYIAARGRVSAGFSLWCLRRADSAHAEIEEVHRNGAQVQLFIRSCVLHVPVK